MLSPELFDPIDPQNMYRLTRQAKVQRTIELNSDEVCLLDAGTLVEVTKKERRDDLQRTRGEIKHPAGWISLEHHGQQISWVEAVQRTQQTEEELRAELREAIQKDYDSQNVYRLTRQAKVQRTIELDSDEVCMLDVGTLVELTNRERRSDLERTRGELKHPVGWITLEHHSKELCWIEAVQRMKLTEQEMRWLTPDILDIYVRARPTLQERLAIITQTLQWRIENRAMLSDLVCPRCTANPLSHDARCFGTDPDGDLVFMNCFKLPRDFNPDGIAQHMACVFERSLQAYPAARQWTWIIHMHGFGVQNLDPRTSIKLLNLLQVAYRDRLKRCVILDAPFLFESLWATLQPFIKQKTHKSIVFRTWPDTREEFFDTLGESVAERISAEITENKDPERVMKKTWTSYWATCDQPCATIIASKDAAPKVLDNASGDDAKLNDVPYKGG